MPRLDGIDGSHYQSDAGPIDWPALANAPTWWIAWKASQSTQYRDPSFAEYRAHSPWWVQHLAYHWLSSTTDPIGQAENFLAATSGFDGGAMLDAEESGITVAKCLAWCEMIEATTHRPSVIYSGLYVAGGTIWKSTDLRTSKYGARPFIVAAYVSEANLAARLKATNSPAPHAWQYSSSGPVPGITGRCDMDMIHDRAAFDVACGISAKPPPPILIEDNMQLVQPRRVFDSRNTSTVKAGQIYTINLGLDAVAAKGCMVNLTATGKGVAGFVVAFGTADPPPTSNVNFTAAATSVANSAVVQVTGGAINVRSSADCDLIIDLQALWP